MTLRRTYLYQQVAEAIRDYIASNRLKPGDTLPSERELCESLGVSRTSLREGLRAVAMMGLVEVRTGQGMFVGDVDLRSVVEAIPTSMLDNPTDMQELTEIREVLEVLATQRAATRISDEELRPMEEAVQRMETRIRRGEPSLEEDIEFHNIIVKAANSRLLTQFLGAISDMVQFIREQGLRRKGAAAQAVDQHRAILQALRERDPKAAGEAMRVHLNTVRSDLYEIYHQAGQSE